MLVLLVEDEPGIREGLAAFLRLKGHVVRAAGSCREGLALLQAETFDAVVTDWRLGDGTGAEVARASAAPVLVMSGWLEEVEGLAATAVLRKPVAPHQLAVELDRLVEQQRPLPCPPP